MKIFFSNDQESYYRPQILENHRALNPQKISRGLVLCIDKILEYFPSEKAFLSKLSLSNAKKDTKVFRKNLLENWNTTHLQQFPRQMTFSQSCQLLKFPRILLRVNFLRKDESLRQLPRLWSQMHRHGGYEWRRAAFASSWSNGVSGHYCKYFLFTWKTLSFLNQTNPCPTLKTCKAKAKGTLH